MVLIVLIASGASCRRTPVPQAIAVDSGTTPTNADASMPALSEVDASRPTLSESDASTPTKAPPEAVAGDPKPASDDPMASHKVSKDDLLALFSIKSFTDQERKRIQPDHFLRSAIGSDGPGHMSQGNKAIASHLVSKEKCLEGLRGVTIQSAEQRAKCGADNMVPVWSKGKEPWFCIDVFEFPNKACELPFVWTPPSWAKKVCELQGKRLCSDIEWNVACRGDPDGGEDWRYAYGAQLDLSLCNDAKGHIRSCVVRDAQSAWATCATETEPSGAFPRCRSRFGVFDQHGNVAEVMMRRQGTRQGTRESTPQSNEVVTQLKGSAWYYDELAKEPNAPVPETTRNKRGAYPDHCNFDPRWHVEPLESAWHVNYHLGFRCCKSIP